MLGVFRPAGSPAEAYYPDGTLAVLPERSDGAEDRTDCRRRLGGERRPRDRHDHGRHGRSALCRSRCRPGSGPEGKTSPEELLAAAHGGCLTMSPRLRADAGRDAAHAASTSPADRHGRGGGRRPPDRGLAGRRSHATADGVSDEQLARGNRARRRRLPVLDAAAPGGRRGRGSAAPDLVAVLVEVRRAAADAAGVSERRAGNATVRTPSISSTTSRPSSTASENASATSSTGPAGTPPEQRSRQSPRVLAASDAPRAAPRSSPRFATRASLVANEGRRRAPGAPIASAQPPELAVVAGADHQVAVRGR